MFTGKMGLPAGGGLSLFCPGGELGQPPPAHMGIPPPYQLDSKLAAGLARTPMYPFPGGTYPYPMLSPEMSQVAASWHTPTMYPISSAASGFRSPYPTSLPISSSSLSSELYRFSPTLGGGLGLGLGPALVPPPPSKSDLDSHHSRYARSLEKGSSSSSSDKPSDSSANSNNKEQNKKPHIKKPLNAFMLYMKEMRAKVVAECTLKESAAINQILGRRRDKSDSSICSCILGGAPGTTTVTAPKRKSGKRTAVPQSWEWHALGREEQAKYYELARRERQLHMQLYPDWSSRANTQRGKKRKRKQETTDGGNNLKKCRARYGLDQQSQWCKPCSPESSSVMVSGGLGLLRPEPATSLPASSLVSPQEPTYAEEEVRSLHGSASGRVGDGTHADGDPAVALL
ncbi:hypothetical protein HW555_011689 [Spodoptera exigua]|uniref:HMG box domain-containing protein n=1 Tax=Spodoptera exigua TaxID=7107 RepID=A0A835G762_SPOEX|nr:hypothetical protein HW555_011689 [Spodoptera exigua]